MKEYEFKSNTMKESVRSIYTNSTAKNERKMLIIVKGHPTVRTSCNSLDKNSEIQTAQIRLPTSTRNSECGEDIKNESKFKKESKLFESVFTRKSSQLNNIRNLNNDVEILNDVEDKNNPVIRKTNGSSLESQITN